MSARVKSARLLPAGWTEAASTLGDSRASIDRAVFALWMDSPDTTAEHLEAAADRAEVAASRLREVAKTIRDQGLDVEGQLPLWEE